MTGNASVRPGKVVSVEFKCTTATCRKYLQTGPHRPESSRKAMLPMAWAADRRAAHGLGPTMPVESTLRTKFSTVRQPVLHSKTHTFQDA